MWFTVFYFFANLSCFGIYEGALRKELSTWMAISALKRHYHWNENPEPEMKEKDESAVFIRLNDDTLIVASDPEWSGTYVKLKKENEKGLPDAEALPRYIPNRMRTDYFIVTEC